MAAKELKRNVHIDGKWYGPAYPDAGAPPAEVENPLAYSEDDDVTVKPEEPAEPVAESKAAGSRSKG